ncbi:MAG: tetratricopeptide repeat protein [Cyanothece sp. SIO1E1]|nr:tetratricopeptide repeat protein [Cyanothece sp. SIO1E1]
MHTEKLLEPDLKSLIEAASQKHQSGQLDQAELLYQQILQVQPQTIAAQNLLAKLSHLIKMDLGNILQKQGKLAAAIETYQQALSLKPDFAEAHNNLATALLKQGKLEAATRAYQHALLLKPDFALAHFYLGEALKRQGKLTAAIQSYQQALKINPNLAAAYNNLGTIFKEQGRFKEAIRCYQQALQLKPDLVPTYNNLGNIFKQQNKLEQAEQCYRQAIDLNSNVVEFYLNLGAILRRQGKLEAALKCCHQVLNMSPSLTAAEFSLCIYQLPIIYSDLAEIKLRRTAYQQHLQKLVDRYQQATLQERANAASDVGTTQPFYLAYQGLNDRTLQQTYGQLICQLMSSCYPQWSHPRPLPKLAANEKIRVGFISGLFYNHSVWKIPLKGWVQNLDRSKFDLFGYYTGYKQDQGTAIATQAFFKFVQGPLRLKQWGEVIAQDQLHVLIFPEFGMDPMTVQLGCLRLAPVQIAFGGHPETSGLPTIEYHLSSDLMEPPNAQDHYTEKLVRLPNLAIHYTPLEVPPQAVTKNEIGIANNEIMFWCCQSLYKYLPQHDDVFPRIAKALEHCKFVFIKNDSVQVTEIFCQRLSRTFAAFGLNYQNYCLLLPRMNASVFAATTAIADVFLDSIGWSGNNTIMESTNYNLPIVTWPGDLMRGRHALGILTMMGIKETIAANKDDYVEIAVRLGQDSQYRQALSRQVAENKHKLYGDLQPVRALENFILNLVH